MKNWITIPGVVALILAFSSSVFLAKLFVADQSQNCLDTATEFRGKSPQTTTKSLPRNLIRPQEDSPLKFISADSNHGTTHITVRNFGGQTISAYGLYCLYDTNG